MSVQGGHGAWQKIVDTIFTGNKGIRRGNPNVILSSGAPTGVTAPLGTLCWDYTNSAVYLNSDGGTTWYKIPANS